MQHATYVMNSTILYIYMYMYVCMPLSGKSHTTTHAHVCTCISNTIKDDIPDIARVCALTYPSPEYELVTSL